MIALHNISKKFGSFALADIDLQIEAGEYFVLLGNSGSGKTLLLGCIAGFIQPDMGIITINSEDVTRKPVQKRNAGMVFHDSAVFPHMSVARNIAYPLEIRRYKKKEIALRVAQLAELTGISHLLQRYPAKLSAGEMQRVALARVLTLKPDVLLLDEPLASLDVQLRSGMRQLLRNLNKQGQTIIHVTHDYEEAALLATRVGIIEQGRIIQTGSPGEVFRNPRSAFAARFAGFRNFYEGQVAELNGKKVFSNATLKVVVADGCSLGNCFIVIRSEDIIISREAFASSACNVLNAKIQFIESHHDYTEVTADAGLPFYVKLTAHSVKSMNLNVDDNIFLHFKASAINCITV